MLAYRPINAPLQAQAQGWLWSPRSRRTVPRHVESVHSVHRRRTYRKSGFVIGRYGNTIPRRWVHCTLSHLPPFVSTYPYPQRASPTPLPFNLLERSASPRISTHRPPQRRVSLCISSRRAACRLRSTWNFIFGGRRFVDERKADPRVSLSSLSVYRRARGYSAR